MYPTVKIEPFTDGLPETAKKVMQVDFSQQTDDYIEELSKIPAFERRKAKDQNNPLANGREVSRITISGSQGDVHLRKNNAFIHDKPD